MVIVIVDIVLFAYVCEVCTGSQEAVNRSEWYSFNPISSVTTVATSGSDSASTLGGLDQSCADFVLMASPIRGQAPHPLLGVFSGWGARGGGAKCLLKSVKGASLVLVASPITGQPHAFVFGGAGGGLGLRCRGQLGIICTS